MKKCIFAAAAVLMVFAMAMTSCDNGSKPAPAPQGEVPEEPLPDYTYTVTFDKNNNDEGSTAPTPATAEVKSPNTTVTASRVPTPPTRPGYIFVNYNTEADGSGDEFKTGNNGTVVTGDMTVYAQWKMGYIVTFSKNTEDSNVPNPNPSTLEFPVTTAGAPVTVGDQMPGDISGRAGFEFLGWNTLSVPKAGEEDTTKFDGNTQVKDSITVYARWKFKGFDPVIKEKTISHELPLFEAANGAVINNNDGTYKLAGGGTLDYLFPTDVGATHENANDYDYFILLTEILSGESGSGTGVAMRPYEGNTVYGGSGTNKQPWLSNSDGKTSIQDVSGAGESHGLRIQAQNGSSVASLRITSITFHKAPRYTVTFDYNYTGIGRPANVVVTGVIGADDNLKGPGVTAAHWPPNPPDRTGETPPSFFLGWEDGDGNIVTASTPITGNMTITAKWTTEEPDGWMELITTTATTAPLYAFTIPAGGKLGDYDHVTFKLKASGSVTGRVRAWGTFPTSIYTEESFPLVEEGKVPSGKSVVNMLNYVEGLLLTNSNAGSSPTNIVSGMSTLNAADGWHPYLLDLVGGRDAKYGQGSSSLTVPYKWEDNATGTILLAIGVVAAGGGSDSRTYFIKDIVLSNADGTKTIEALDPRDESLWGGQGQTAFVRQGDAVVTSRTIYYYEED